MSKRPAPRLRDRIVLFFMLLLLGVQVASFLAIRYAISSTAQQSLRDELRVAARVFQRISDQNAQQLLAAARVLASDFGFRSALGSRDRATIVSALQNHASRVNASRMSVIGMDGGTIADTLATPGPALADADLLARASVAGEASAVRATESTLEEIVVVPVLAPNPIAWVATSFTLGQKSAVDLRTLTSSEVSFLEVRADGTRVFGSTLPAPRQAQLAAAAPVVVAAGTAGATVELDDGRHEALAATFDDSGRVRVFAILQRSQAEGIAPYLALQAALFFIAALSLVVTFVGAVRIARRVTKPLWMLSLAARDVAQGRYDVVVPRGGSAEIDELAGAFEGMVRGLKDRDNVRDVLGKVASQEVVRELLDKRVELGGQELDATVMFTDVRNFTALCESLPPKQSLAFLNEFLTIISAVVEEHGGVVDKYVGDGVMALFGAPVTRADDTQRAVEAALAIHISVEELRPKLAARGMPSPQIGIGLNTSRVVAGNVGSPSRLNYTVMGDGVNLASRLEGLTKRYHVPIVVGEATRAAVKGIVFRELDKVRVRGKTVPVRIWEPLCHEGRLTRDQERGLQRWHAALQAFRERRFAMAAQEFDVLQRSPGYERLAAIYRGYLEELQKAPPAADWDAAFTLYDK